MNFPATSYKPCPKKCGMCKQCKDFASVVKQIDVTRKSDYDRRREAEAQLRRER